MQQTLKPYLINAFYTWSMDIGYTPLICVEKWSKNTMPKHLTNESNVIFTIHPNAVKNLILGKHKIEFEAIFSGHIEHVEVDYDSISRIFNKEDNFGLDFDIRIEDTRPNLRLIKDEKE